MAKFLFPAAALVAASAFADFSPDTIGFYPFTDGEAGSSAANATLANAANPGTFDATGIKHDQPNTYAKGIVDFDADAPGTYVFASNRERYPEPICTNPQSLNLSVRNDREQNYLFSGGFVSFADMSTELSKNDEWTIEFFWKIPADQLGVCTYSDACVLDFGFTDAGGQAKKLALALPLAMGSASYGTRVSLNEKGSGNWQSAYYESLITYDDWHHVAISFSNGKAKLTCDYRYSVTLTGSYTPHELAESLPLVFGSNGSYSAFHGKVACFRFSKKALETDDFLRVSENPHYHAIAYEPENLYLGPNTRAFYSFKTDAGHVGESAVGVDILNSVDKDTHYGVTSRGSSGTGDMTFDEDAPGKYVFTACEAGATCCCTNPLSLNFNKGQLSFSAIETELSKLSESTIEFFWKLPTDGTEAGYVQLLRFFNIVNPDSEADSMDLYIPVANHTSDPGRGKEVRLASGKNISAHNVAYAYPEFPGGPWHHIAIVYDNGTFKLYLDYTLRRSLSGFGRTPVSTASSLILGYGGFRGKVSCLRFSDKALEPGEMIYASSLPTCCPLEVFRFRCDEGVAGSAMSSVLNTAPSYKSFNPGVSLPDDVRNGEATSGGKLPVASSSTWWKQVRDGVGADPMTNGGSAYFETTPKASPSAIFATGPSVRYSYAKGGPMTVEAFVRFDYEKFMEHIGNVFGETRDRVNLFGFERSGSSALFAWRLYVQGCKGTSPYPQLDVVCEDGSLKSFVLSSKPLGPAFRNRWHHFAFIYDEATCNVKVYYDYNLLLDETLASPIDFSKPGNNYFQFGAGGNNQPFDGWMDEIRFTKKVLSPDEFLRADGKPGSVMVLE